MKYVIAIQVELHDGPEQDQEAVDAAVEATVDELDGMFYVEDDDGNETAYTVKVSTCLHEDKVAAMTDTIDIGNVN